jgi:hypothetical protein
MAGQQVAKRLRADGKAAVVSRRLPYRYWLWAIVIASYGMFAGAMLDAWSHVHIPELDAVFNPWHWPVYGSFVALVLLLGLPATGRFIRGRAMRTVVPRSYRLPVVGGVIFFASGQLDLIWHAALGIEVGVEAMLSPTHLGLAVGAALLWALPLRLAWGRRGPISRQHHWLAISAASLLIGLVLFSTHYANLLVDAWPLYPFSEQDLGSWYVPTVGFAALIIQTAVVMGGVLLLLRRWPELPTGALALVFVLSGGGLVFLHDMSSLVIVPVLTGLVAEILRRVFRPFAGKPMNTVSFAASAPAAQAVIYLVTLEVIGNIAWSSHLVAGMVAIAALTGALVSLLLVSSSEGRSGRRVSA